MWVRAESLIYAPMLHMVHVSILPLKSILIRLEDLNTLPPGQVPGELGKIATPSFMILNCLHYLIRGHAGSLFIILAFHSWLFTFFHKLQFVLLILSFHCGLGSDLGRFSYQYWVFKKRKFVILWKKAEYIWVIFC